MKEMIYDTSDFDDIDGSNTFSQEIIAVFLKELETLLPSLGKNIEDKDALQIYQAIHKVKPTIHLLKIKHIFTEVDEINTLKESIWNNSLKTNTIKIIEHLKIVEAEMKKA